MKTCNFSKVQFTAVILSCSWLEMNDRKIRGPDDINFLLKIVLTKLRFTPSKIFNDNFKNKNMNAYKLSYKCNFSCSYIIEVG